MRRPRPSLLLLALVCACVGARGESSAPTQASAPAPAPVEAAPAPDPVEPAPVEPAAPSVTIDDDAGALLAAEGVLGGFLLVKADGARIDVHPDELERGHLPASTFKIPNTLIGLETGVIPDEHFTLKWDRKKQRIKAWERDHDLASAMQNSVVWYYQEVARRIGAERMQAWIDRFDYGNRDLGGGIDKFWLAGSLRISAREQVRFLQRLDAGELGVSPRSREILDKITILEQTPEYTWRGKTGLTDEDGGVIGWLVGSVERDGQRAYYATILRLEREDFEYIMPRRRTITRQLLVRHGLLPAAPPE